MTELSLSNPDDLESSGRVKEFSPEAIFLWRSQVLAERCRLFGERALESKEFPSFEKKPKMSAKVFPGYLNDIFENWRGKEA